MYDIFCDIWKHPESAFTPMPVWARLGGFCGEGSAEEISAELSEMHKRGVDGVVACPAADASVTLEAYLKNLGEALCALKKRHMTAVLSDFRMAERTIVAEEPRLAARRLYVLPARTELPDGEELLYRVSVSFDDKDRLIDTKLSPTEGYTEYDIILGYSYESGYVDSLNPQTAYDLIEQYLDVQYDALGEYFGDTVVGVVVPTVRFAEGEIPWTYAFIEDFFEAGGDMHMLMSLFFEPREKKHRREAELVMRKAVAARLNDAYLGPISQWCEKHRIAMMYCPGETVDSALYRHVSAPGTYLGEQNISTSAMGSEDSVGVKLAADYAGHHGQKRSFARLTDTDGITPDEVMCRLNFAFARGSSMIISDEIRLHESEDGIEPSVVRADYKKLAAYVKRMAWLNSTGTHNPSSAILCTADYVPWKSACAVAEAGHSFSFLTLDDLMERCSVRDGKLCIDRFEYDTLLIDSRVRLDARSVTKIGRFVTEGGKMYRGGDFIGFIDKNVRRTSYFEGSGTAELYFTHITKGGVDFFVMSNSGDRWIEGGFVTDIPHAASDFNALTGAITPLSASMCDGGFRYPVRIPPHSAKIIGMNKRALPHLAEEKTYKLCEITSISPERVSFEYSAEYNRAVLSFTDVYGALDVSVNGTAVKRMMFKPYEVDITDHVACGINSLEITGEFDGGCVKLYS